MDEGVRKAFETTIQRLEQIEKNIGLRFKAMERRFKLIENRLEKMDNDSSVFREDIDERFGLLNGKLDGISVKMEALDELKQL